VGHSFQEDQVLIIKIAQGVLITPRLTLHKISLRTVTMEVKWIKLKNFLIV